MFTNFTITAVCIKAHLLPLGCVRFDTGSTSHPLTTNSTPSFSLTVALSSTISRLSRLGSTQTPTKFLPSYSPTRNRYPLLVPGRLLLRTQVSCNPSSVRGSVLILYTLGIAPLAYVPPSTPVARANWPTLGSLIDSGKRVLIFFDDVAGGGLNYVMPEFDMIWEPPFSVTDNTFPCSVDRISGSLSVAQHMNMLNHNLNSKVFGSDVLIPDYVRASTTNGRTS